MNDNLTDSSTIAHAVHAIGMMPKEVACKWRAIVFKMAFVSRFSVFIFYISDVMFLG